MLQLVEKNSLAYVSDLTKEEELLLSSPPLKGSSKEGIHKDLLLDIKQKNLWIKCNCSSNPAIMTIREKENNTHLVNINERGKHNTECPFYKLTLGKSSNGKLHKEGMKQSFIFHKLSSTKEIDPDASPTSGGATTKKSEDSLYRLLACLFESAGINTISSKTPNSYKERVKKILSTAEQFRLGSKPLSAELFWGLTNHHKAYSSLEQELENSDNVANVPTKVIMSVIDNYDVTPLGLVVTSIIKSKEGDKKFTITLDKEAKIVLANKRFNSQDAPFILIYTLIYDTKEEINNIRVGRAYIRPIASVQNLIPVDNRYERIAINKAQNLLNFYKKHGQLFKIERPLLSISSPITSVHIRPDLIISTPYENTIINIYANTEQNYLTARESMNKYMNELGSVTIIENREDDESEDENYEYQTQHIEEDVKTVIKKLIYS